MKYTMTSAVLYLGKYNQPRHDGSTMWCKLSFGVKEQLVINGKTVKCPIDTETFHSEWLDAESTDELLTLCRKRGTKAVKLTELCKGDDLAFRIPMSAVDEFGPVAAVQYLIETEAAGFTIESHDLGCDHTLVNPDGSVVKKDGKDVVKRIIQIHYWTASSSMSKDAQLAKEVKKWRRNETTSEVLQRLADEFSANKKQNC